MSDSGLPKTWPELFAFIALLLVIILLSPIGWILGFWLLVRK